MSKKEFWVRLKPLNPRKGYKLQRYMAFGLRFEVQRNWYRVPEAILRLNEEINEREELNVIEYLAAVRNDNDDPDSPLAFDICTEEEAKEMDAAAKRAKEAEAAKAENPNPVDLVSMEERKRPTAKPPSVDPAGQPKRGRGRPPKAKPPAATPTE